MKPKKKKSTSSVSTTLPWIRKELFGLLFLAITIFYYLSLLSYSPRDPSFMSLSQWDQVKNLGGVTGAYVAGVIFFLIGAGGYFLGAYFATNALLMLTGKREHPKLIDFITFLVCSIFVAVLLQIQLHTIHFDELALNAGGTLGQILSEVGQTYLGRLGVYVIVLFGSILTFVLATRLSLIETLNASSVVLGRGMGSLGGQVVTSSVRLQKVLVKMFQNWQDWLSERRAQKELIALPQAEPKLLARKSVEPESHAEFAGDDDIEEDPSEEFFKAPTKRVEPKIRERRDRKVSKSLDQFTLPTVSEGYQLPPLGFLDSEDSREVTIDADSLKMNARILEKKLKDFAILGTVTEIHPGPVITMYEFEPAPGIKLSKIVGLSDDLSLAMGGRSVRIVAPLPNKPAVGIEIPNHERETVWLKDIIGDEKFQKHDSRIAFALGKDIEGIPFVADLQKMPHVLVAGATGAGKSVSINTMVCSILYKARPDEVQMIMIDPKMIELSIYEGIPHLMLPVVTDPRKANLALKWAVQEMERRYKLLSDVNARNLANYNKHFEQGEIVSKPQAPGSNEEPVVHTGKLPLIVIIIDEFADLMMVSSKEVEESVCRLAQKARAAGIHLILATQRPSVDVITGIIKANFPSRIAFKVTSKHDARTIMDSMGAEALLGMGDMLFVPPGTSNPMRLHGAFVTETEITRIVDFVKSQAKPNYHQEIILSVDADEDEAGAKPQEDYDEYYDQAVRQVSQTKRVSVSGVQRQFRIGYNRAARIVEQMEREGVVSSPNHQGQREVLVQSQ